MRSVIVNPLVHGLLHLIDSVVYWRGTDCRLQALERYHQVAVQHVDPRVVQCKEEDAVPRIFFSDNWAHLMRGKNHASAEITLQAEENRGGTTGLSNSYKRERSD